MKLSLFGYYLAVKYWLSGDDWQFAKEYAFAITNWAAKSKAKERK